MLEGTTYRQGDFFHWRDYPQEGIYLVLVTSVMHPSMEGHLQAVIVREPLTGGFYKRGALIPLRYTELVPVYVTTAEMEYNSKGNLEVGTIAALYKRPVTLWGTVETLKRRMGEGLYNGINAALERVFRLWEKRS